MNKKTEPLARPDYGLDAPGVVRNLLIAGALALTAGLTALFGVWPDSVNPILVMPGFSSGICLLAMAIWMIWSSRVGKIRERETLLDRIKWRGDEQALDVGCGRGLMLIGMAKRLTTGKATGIDIWQTEDLSGNDPKATLENASREGVSERVDVRTADMRELPFADATFDVIVSSWAIHNLYEANDRVQAIREMARVLKPGGIALIKDIRHISQYAESFRRNNCPDIKQFDSLLSRLITTIVTFGSLRPRSIEVRKPAVIRSSS